VSLEIEKTADPRGLRLLGELDIASEDALTEAFEREAGRNGDFTLEVSELTFIDSAGVRALIKAADSLQGRGRLIIRSPGETLQRVFQLMRLDTVPNVEIAGDER
jgi:anti-anti-sigma factor